MVTDVTSIRLQATAVIVIGSVDNSDDIIVALSLIVHNDKLHKEID
jgi:hypothetical protein